MPRLHWLTILLACGTQCEDHFAYNSSRLLFYRFTMTQTKLVIQLKKMLLMVIVCDVFSQFEKRGSRESRRTTAILTLLLVFSATGSLSVQSCNHHGLQRD